MRDYFRLFLFLLFYGGIRFTSVQELTAQDLPGKKDSLRIESYQESINPHRKTILYFAVHGMDTSRFKCKISESQEGRVGLQVLFDPSLSYREQFYELHYVLKAAQREFRLDSLRSISLGRLFSTGDLAIQITNQYLLRYKKIPSSLVNKEVSIFLFTSKLVEDFNTILQPYLVQVRQIEVEKSFFAEKKYLRSMSQLETDASQVPPKLLDALVMMTVW